MTHSLNIAFIAPRFAEGPTVGGAETLLRELAFRCTHHGHRVTFLTSCARNHFTWANEVKPGIRPSGPIQVQYFPVNEDRNIEDFLRIQQRISAGQRVPREDEETWIANSVNSRAFEEHLRDHIDEYDALVAGPYLFGMICHAARTYPEKMHLVPCLHDEPFAYLQAIREMFESISGFMFNTEPERDLANRLYDLDAQRCHVVGMGLEPFTAAPHAFAKQYHLNTPYLLYSGRREPMKGTPLLTHYMHAFRERTGQDIHLVFTGSGTIDAPPEMSDHILDAGFVSEQEKQEAMAGSLAFCHPSTHESLSIVLLESWLAGRPALVHAGSDVLTYQCRRSGGGLWFRNYPEFEESLLTLIEQPDLANRMGASGQSYTRKVYDWQAVEQRMLNALDGGHAL